MRLTLRTLLAYLDDILEPDDAQQMQRKIEDSEFATNLVHRTRNVIGKLRLGAPALSGRGMGVDANTVAEYLDNTLTAERVPEFEKLCLESDIHLAEAASCHQILTLLLGEPAEVDAQSREKMYGIPQQVEAAAKAAAASNMVVEKPTEAAVGLAAVGKAAENGAAGKVAPAKEEQPAPPRKKLEVPDYLRDAPSPWRVWKAVAALLLVGLLMGVVVMAIQPDWLPEFARLDSGPPALPPAPPFQVSTGAPDETGATAPRDDDAAASDEAAADASTTDDQANAAESDDEGTEPIGEVVETEGDDEASAASDEDAADEGAADDGDDEAANDDAGAEEEIGDDEMPADESAADDAAEPADGGAESADNESADNESADAAPADTELAAATPAEPAIDEPAEAANTAAAVVVGRLVTNDSLLLHHDPANSHWQRLRPQSTLRAGDRLISPPAFTSTIALTDDVTMHVVGDTSIKLLGPDAAGLLGVRIDYGRAVLLTVGKAEVKLRLELANRDGVITFGDGGAAIAIEVLPVHDAGTDPATVEARWLTELYAVDGTVRWAQTGATEELTLETPAHRTLGIPDEAVASRAAAPDWYPTNPLSPIDKKASEWIEEALRDFDRSTVLGLQELAEDRRKEVRSLALRCLASIGQYEPLIAALSDPGQKTNWNDQADALSAAAVRGPEPAKEVRLALAAQRADRADALYRMLYGYTAPGLKAGDAEVLVETLDHPDLDFRVLAFWNLRNITGKGLFYRPEYPDAKRRSYVQKWEQLLNSGQIVPRAEGAPAANGEAAPAAGGRDDPGAAR